jgi:hypothetical protein
MNSPRIEIRSFGSALARFALARLRPVPRLILACAVGHCAALHAAGTRFAAGMAAPRSAADVHAPYASTPVVLASSRP